MNTKRHHLSLFISLVFALFCFLTPVQAEDLTGPVLVGQAPKIDGVLNESEWHTAFEISDLKVVDPETGETPTLKTQFKFLYDQKNLYIGVINEQPKSTLVRRLSARDYYSQYVDRDQIEIAIDPTAQGLYGYSFVIALGDSLTDGTIRPEREYSRNWDGPYRTATTSDDNNWYVEIAIPWDIMDFPSKEGRRIIGIYLQRDVAHLSERWAYPNIPKNSGIFLKDFSKVDVQDINPQGNLILFPYASAGYDAVLGERTQDIGLDLFWQANTNLLVSGTINPDFGDVENDDVEANFDSTETLLQEKRTFFVEGKDIFETKGLTLIHTRRIGDAPDEPVAANGFDYKPQTCDILGAFKVTGSADKMRYGFITAFEDDSEYQLANGTRSEVEGRNFYGARALFENHSRKSDYIGIGYLGTYVDHDTYGAMVNSVDAQWLTYNSKLRLEGQVATSSISVDNSSYAEEWAIDNDIEDGTGYAYNGKIIYYPTPVSHLIAEINAMESEFNHNDFGYASRLDRTHFNLEYRNNLSHIKNTKWWNYMLYGRGDYNRGHLLKTEIGMSTFVLMDNLQKAFLQAYYVPKSWDDVVTYQKDMFRTKEGFFVWLSWFTDESKPLFFYINPRYYTEKNGNITKYYRGRIKYTPFDFWYIDAEVTYWNKQHWLIGKDVKDNNRVDAFNADQFQVTLKSNFKLTAKQELRLQIQWLGIDVEDKVRYEIGPDGRLISQPIDWHKTITPLDGYDDNRSFSYSQFIGQIRYKYEFAPLCDLFVVYNRAGLFTGTPEAWDDTIFDGWDKRDVDKFLVKIRYRF